MTNELEPEDVTLDLIYEHTHGGPTRQLATGDAIDAKAVQIFAAASVVLGFGTFTTADLDTQLRCCMEPPPPRISAPAAPRGWSFKRGVIASLMGPIDGGRATASRSRRTFASKSSTTLRLPLQRKPRPARPKREAVGHTSGLDGD